METLEEILLKIKKIKSECELTHYSDYYNDIIYNIETIVDDILGGDRG